MEVTKPVQKFKETLLDGEIVLYKHSQREESAWYLRFKDPTGASRYVRQSLKTSNLQLASKLALEVYLDAAGRHSVGAPLQRSISFDKIFDRFHQELSGTTATKAARLYKLYWKSWFSSNVSDLFLIQDSDLLRFTRYRIDFYNSEKSATEKNAFRYVKKTPSTATLSKELSLLSFFLRRAFEYRLISVLVRVPSMKKLRELVKQKELPRHIRRARFSDDEMRKFTDHLRSTMLYNQKESPEERATYTRGQGSNRHRFLSARNYVYIMLISNTGMRPQACRLLQWKDILKPIVQDGVAYTRILIEAHKCKTGIERTIVSRDFLETYRRVVAYKKEWQRYHGTASPEDYLFVSGRKSTRDKRTGKLPPTEMTVPIKLALRKCNLWEKTTNGITHRRSAYSVRSYFITQTIARGCSIEILSRQCATSIKMISDYYDQCGPVTFASFISQHDSKYTFEKDLNHIDLLTYD